MNNESIPKDENSESKTSLTNPWSERVKSLVVDDELEMSTKGLYQRQTHSKAGEHAFIAYNEHRDQNLDGECFVWVADERYKWFEHQGPETVYADNLTRLAEILSFFDPLTKERVGQVE